MSSYTLSRRDAAGLVWRKAKAIHGVSRLQALAAAIAAFLSTRRRRTVER